MIPYLLAALGGYLIGDSIGEDIDKKIPKFADGGETLKNYQVIGTIVKEVGSEPPPEADREDYIDIEREEFNISVMASSEKEAERIAEEEMMDKHLLDEYGSSFTGRKQYYSGSVEIEDVIETGRYAKGGGVGNIKSYRYDFDTYIEIEGTNYGGKLKIGYAKRNVGGRTETYPYLSEILWDDNNVPDNSDEIETFVDKNLDKLLLNAWSSTRFADGGIMAKGGTIKSKKVLFKDLEEIDPVKFKGVGIKSKGIDNETYGGESYIYIDCDTSGGGYKGINETEDALRERKRIEYALIKKGYKVNTDYNKGGGTIEVRVSYFKGNNWDE